MAQKPEIQYIGQFYVYGSEAKKVAEKQELDREIKELPSQRVESVKKIYLDPLAIGSILAAAVLLVTMVLGTLSLQTAWQQLETAQLYVHQLQTRNHVLSAQCRAGYDLEEVRSAALAMGMIPVEEAEVMHISVTVPVQEPEPGWKEELVWFLEGLFA